MTHANFCWECGRKLYGDKFKAVIVDGQPRVMHVSCAKAHEKGEHAPAVCDWELDPCPKCGANLDKHGKCRCGYCEACG